MKTVFLIVNGSLAMSAGKIAAQSFQAAQRLLDKAGDDPELAEALASWKASGTRTRTKVAPTAHLFERAMRDLVPERAAVMIDEGNTEVDPGSATVIATWPMDESELPRILRHKRIRTMTPCACASAVEA
jgi:peptidyl-tRNA hydrolase